MSLYNSIITSLNEFFYHHQLLGIFSSGFIAFIESLAVAGSIVPGSVVMTFVGIMIGTGILPIEATLISIFCGAFIG